MRMRFCGLALVSALGCGGGNPADGGADEGLADASPHDAGRAAFDAEPALPPDASAACTPLSVSNQRLDGGSDVRIDFRFDVDSGIASVGSARGVIMFRGGRGDLSGIYDLSDPSQQDLSTCTACVFAYGVDDEDNIIAAYMQRSGQLELDVDPMAGQLAGRLIDVELGQADLSPTALTSTPIAGGACVRMPALELDVPL